MTLLLAVSIRTSTFEAGMELPQLFVVCFILLAALAGAQRPPEFNTQYCGEYHNNISGLTDELRLLIIQQHNVYRSYLANGNVPGECGDHPTCKNVYTLVSAVYTHDAVYYCSEGSVGGGGQ